MAGSWATLVTTRCANRESKLMDSCPPDELGVPDILLVLAEEVIFDGLRGILTGGQCRRHS